MTPLCIGARKGRFWTTRSFGRTHAEIEALNHPLRLDRDTVDMEDDIAGSNYLVTHRLWVDWMEQCLSRGREYVIRLDEARRLYPKKKIPDDI